MACCGTGIVPSWQVAAACLAEDVILTDGSTKGEGGRGSHLRSTGWCRSPQGWSFDTLSEAGWCLWFGACPSRGFFSLQQPDFPMCALHGVIAEILVFQGNSKALTLWKTPNVAETLFFLSFLSQAYRITHLRLWNVPLLSELWSLRKFGHLSVNC